MTRLHSSRMRTARALTVSPRKKTACSAGRGGVCSRGMSAPGGCLLPGGVSALGVSAQGGVCLLPGGCLL